MRSDDGRAVAESESVIASEVPSEVLGDRRRLLNLAYRMLGTMADSEDVVQETFLRWYRLTPDERSGIDNPAAWLTRVASRICLDLLGSARVRREQYVGQWLPEPRPDAESLHVTRAADPVDHAMRRDEVSMAMLVVLETLTPAERVSLVLHDVFGLPFDEIAQVLGRSPMAARKLASTARRHVADRRPRAADDVEHARVLAAFWRACETGDLAGLVALLDPEAIAVSDGGGVVRAALKPVRGADRVARFLLGILAKQAEMTPSMRLVGGSPAIAFGSDDRVNAVVTLDVRAGVVTDLWIVLNPDKLGAWNALDQPGG